MAVVRTSLGPGAASVHKLNTRDWDRILVLATGCQDEYIQRRPTGVRLDDSAASGSSSKGKESDIQCLLLMQEGLPVLFYTGKEQGFQQRVLKVDSRASFCYILPIASRHDDLHVVPLDKVQVQANSEALSLCQSLGISDPNLTYDSTVALVKFADMEDESQQQQESYVFISPPHTFLKERLQACCSTKASGTKKNASKGGLKSKCRLDGVRLKDPFAPYKDSTRKVVELEVQWLTPAGHPGGRFMEHKLKIPQQLKKCPEQITTIQEKGFPFSAVDYARVLYVLRELVTIYSWARLFKRLFQEEFYTFLTEKPPVTKRKEETGDDLESLRGPEVINRTCTAPSLEEEDRYSIAAIRTLLKALRHNMELENEIIILKQRLGTVDEQQDASSAPEQVLSSPAASSRAAAPGAEAAEITPRHRFDSTRSSEDVSSSSEDLPPDEAEAPGSAKRPPRTTWWTKALF